MNTTPMRDDMDSNVSPLKDYTKGEGLGTFPAGTWTLTATPPPAGHYQIGGPIGLSIDLRKRPSWLARLFSRWLLQWVWVDAP